MRCGRCGTRCPRVERVVAAQRNRDRAERLWLRASDELREAYEALSAHETSIEKEAA